MNNDLLLIEKKERLKELISRYSSIIIAYSGGTDSGFLLATAFEILKDNVIAVTMNSPIYPKREIESAKTSAIQIGVHHIILESDETKHSDFIKNSKDRCYICKKMMFKQIQNLADQMNIQTIMHGSNADDAFDYRPGLKAAQEAGVIAPLADAGLTKSEIRQLSNSMNLSFWNKPAMACLATRIPYNIPITIEKLNMIEKAETLLQDLGFSTCRVRHHGEVAKIEILPNDFNNILTIRETIIRHFKQIGFHHIAMDLEGYVSGKMNV